jgi:hypothetical protein
MDSTTSFTQTVPVWPFSYQGVGFIVLPLNDGTYQGIIQGGYYTVPCATPGQALALVRELIIHWEGGQH